MWGPHLDTSTLQGLVLISLCLLLLFLLYRRGQQSSLHESFANPQYEVTNLQGSRQQVVKKGSEQIYDSFYAEVYDQLFQSDTKNEYECLQIQKNYLKEWKAADGKPTKVRLLDAGCGTGHHLRIFQRYGHEVEGVDASLAMVKQAKRRCPKAVVRKGDITDLDLYPKRNFTHITCLFYTIYYCNNVATLFRNFNRWLEPKGLLFVHVVNPKRFDPVLERSSALVPLFDPQRHSKSRQTHTTLEFQEFTYEADWDLTQPKRAQFREHFLFKEEPYDRHHTHELCFVSTKKIIKRANDNGFELLKNIDLFLTGHTYNYIMVFQKRFGD